jgi:hypothetical protein
MNDKDIDFITLLTEETIKDAENMQTSPSFDGDIVCPAVENNVTYLSDRVESTQSDKSYVVYSEEMGLATFSVNLDKDLKSYRLHLNDTTLDFPINWDFFKRLNQNEESFVKIENNELTSVIGSVMNVELKEIFFIKNENNLDVICIDEGHSSSFYLENIIRNNLDNIEIKKPA